MKMKSLGAKLGVAGVFWCVAASGAIHGISVHAQALPPEKPVVVCGKDMSAATCKAEVDRIFYGDPKSKLPGVLRQLVSQVERTYQGKPTGKKRLPTSPVPICSLQRGPIQIELLKARGKTKGTSFEDKSNYLGQNCGDPLQIKLSGKLPAPQVGLLYDSSSPADLKSKGPFRGQWERSHINSIEVLALEEAYLQVLGEVSTTGRLVPQTAFAIAGQEVLAKDPKRLWMVPVLIREEIRHRAERMARNTEFHGGFLTGLVPLAKAGGEQCVSTVAARILKEKSLTLAAVERAVNQECMPQLKGRIRERVRELFPLVFAMAGGK